MSKSVLTILVIGVIGAVLMSLVMKHLVEVAVERDRSPYAAAVESRLGAKRIGPVRITEEAVGEHVQLAVHAQVLAGLDQQRLADTLGLEVWLLALRSGARLDGVSVVLMDEDGDGERTFVIPAPSTRRARPGPPEKSAPGKQLRVPSGGVPAGQTAAPTEQGPLPAAMQPKVAGSKPPR